MQNRRTQQAERKNPFPIVASAALPLAAGEAVRSGKHGSKLNTNPWWSGWEKSDVFEERQEPARVTRTV